MLQELFLLGILTLMQVLFCMHYCWGSWFVNMVCFTADDKKNQYNQSINKTTTPLDKLFSVFQSQTLSNLFSLCAYMNKTFGYATM